MRGLFAGYSAFLLRDLPFDAVEFAAYEALKSIYTGHSKRKLNAIESGVTGAVAGGFTGILRCFYVNRFFQVSWRLRLTF